ncbi:MAG: sarcosine oxidase subunit gamma [Paracoccaceae bacterium]
MHDLVATSPLGGPRPRTGNFGSVVISECPGWALASVAARRGKEKTMATSAKKLLGFALPGVSSLANNGTYTAFWTGPDQWMIEAPHASHEDLAEQIKSALGDKASVTEQNDGWARFDLTGTGCHDVLERLCNANTRAMQTGAVTRTRLEHLGCFVICRAKNDHFSVIGPRSSAGSIHHALTTAAKSAL